MNVLKCKSISKSFSVDNKKIDILKGIDLSIDRGEFVAIRGASGSGKSTFLSIIAGLDKPTNGSISILGRDVTNLSEDEISNFRNQDIGLVHPELERLCSEWLPTTTT